MVVVIAVEFVVVALELNLSVDSMFDLLGEALKHVLATAIEIKWKNIHIREQSK